MLSSPARRVVPVAAGVLLTGLVASGCSGGSSTADRRAATTSPAPATSPTSPTPSAEPSTPRSATPTPPDPGPSTPATTAGDLSLRSFPPPRRLGPRWQFLVDPGDTEGGYVGNGTPALARDPHQVVQAAVPLGCPRTAAMPLPQHTLEVDYRYRGVKVVVLRSTFTDRHQAADFFAARAADLRACRGHVSVPAEGPMVQHLTRPRRGVLLSDRTPQSAPWTELAVRDGRAVVLLASQSGWRQPPLTPARTHRIAAAFRTTA